MVQIMVMERLDDHFSRKPKPLYYFDRVLVYAVSIVILCKRTVVLIGQLHLVLFILSLVNKQIVYIDYIDVRLQLLLRLLHGLKRRGHVISRHIH